MMIKQAVGLLQIRIRQSAIRLICFISLAVLAGLLPFAADAAEPIVTDSRIKTYVYNENEVFPLIVHYGYQSYIEFAQDEEVSAVSMGDANPWQIIPVKNRLFVKPLDGYANTNMTVITNKRTYQFDIESRIPPKELDAELTYVVRFYYPDTSFDRLALSSEISNPRLELPLPTDQEYNFQYSLSGPDYFAPIKVFDDGRATYFEFPPGLSQVPFLAVLEYAGNETAVQYRRIGEYIVVDTTSRQFTIRMNNELVCVFNERFGGVR